MQPEQWDVLGIDLATVIERAPLPLGVMGAEGRFALVNPALAALLGRTRVEVLRAEGTDFLHEDDREAGLDVLQRLLRREVTELSRKLRYVRRDGTVVAGGVVFAAVTGADGRVAGVVVQVEDVTAELAAAEARDEISSLVAVLDEAVVTLNAEGTVRSWNAAAERLLGWRVDEIVGRPASDLAPAEGADDAPGAMARFARGQTVQSETTCVHKDGSLVSVALTATPIHDSASRLVAAIGVLRDISEQQRAAQRLEHLARHDVLTGLPNRREFGERLATVINRSRGPGNLVGLLFIDLDRFKEINDSRGHLAGDEYLRVIGARLAGATRPGDAVARWGGDEFAVLVEARSAEEVAAVAARLLSALARPVHIQGVDLPAAASIGAATAQAPTSPDDLMRAADNAMYLAKNRGGNQWAGL